MGAGGSWVQTITLKIHVLEVDGAAVAAVEEPGAYEVRQTGAGVVLALPKERDLWRDRREMSVRALLHPRNFRIASKPCKTLWFFSGI